jgi:hypothetical protein
MDSRPWRRPRKDKEPLAKIWRIITLIGTGDA